MHYIYVIFVCVFIRGPNGKIAEVQVPLLAETPATGDGYEHLIATTCVSKISFGVSMHATICGASSSILMTYSRVIMQIAFKPSSHCPHLQALSHAHTQSSSAQQP